MCGRFASFLPPEAIARMFGTVNPLPNLPPNWNVAPTQDTLVVRRHPRTGERHLDLLRWGLLPYWTKEPGKARRPINARAESVATSGMFREAFAQRRCLVPADAFYEWKPESQGKRPYAIAHPDGTPLALAGLWEGFRQQDGSVLRSFAIITTNANAELARLHDRMPAIIAEADWPVWLGEVQGEPKDLLRPAPKGALRAWPIGNQVSNPSQNGPDLLTPIES